MAKSSEGRRKRTKGGDEELPAAAVAIRWQGVIKRSSRSRGPPDAVSARRGTEELRGATERSR
jgi:hypothetical protein